MGRSRFEGDAERARVARPQVPSPKPPTEEPQTGLLAWQRAIGNRAVSKLVASTRTLQRAVSGGQKGDRVQHEGGALFTITDVTRDGLGTLYELKGDDGSTVRVFSDVRTYQLLPSAQPPTSPTGGDGAAVPPNGSAAQGPITSAPTAAPASATPPEARGSMQALPHGGGSFVYAQGTSALTLQTTLLKGGTGLKEVEYDEFVKGLAEDKAVKENKNPATDWAQFTAAAKADIDGNACRAYTRWDDSVYALKGQWSEADVIHEMVHLCSGPGGDSAITQAVGGTFNEGVTQFFTEEIHPPAKGKAYPDATEMARILATPNSSVRDGLFQAMFTGGGADAFFNALFVVWDGHLQSGTWGDGTPVPKFQRGKKADRSDKAKGEIAGKLGSASSRPPNLKDRDWLIQRLT